MIPHFDTLADDYDTTRGLLPDPALEQIADTVESIVRAGRNTRFLEVGVGTGRVALPFVLRGYPFTGADISVGMMERFRSKVAGRDVRLGLVQTDAASLPFRSASFDVALTAHVLYLVSDWRASLREIRRVLKPGGTYLFCHEESERDPLADSIDSHWFEMVAERGWATPGGWQSSVTNAEVLALLREQGASISTVVAASWEGIQPLASYLQAYATTVARLYEHVPAAEFAAMVATLEEWVTQRIDPSISTLATRFSFVIDVVESWGGAQPEG